MSSIRDIPHQLRDFHKVFEKLSYYKYDPSEIMTTFLEWVMWGFCSDNSLDWTSGARFKKDERKVFSELFVEWIKIQDNHIKMDIGWFDMLGTYYEAHIAGKPRRNNKGQFFTPPHICDFMALTMGENGQIGQRVGNPTCGGGRLLLAFHAKFSGNYLYAEDIDRMCCLMTVLVHGAVGEVVHHNSLDPDSWMDGWIVKENLNNPLHKHHSIPNVRRLQREDSFITKHWEWREELIEDCS